MVGKEEETAWEGGRQPAGGKKISWSERGKPLVLEGGDKVAAQEDYVACERRGINCLGYCL